MGISFLGNEVRAKQQLPESLLVVLIASMAPPPILVVNAPVAKRLPPATASM